MDVFTGYQPLSEEKRNEMAEAQKNADKFWAKVKKITINALFFCLGFILVFAGIKFCTGWGANDTAVSVELERITGELERVKGELLDAEFRATELTSELQSVRAEFRRSTEYSRQLEDELGSLRTASTAVGGSIGIIDSANKAIGDTIRNIDGIIRATNQANKVP
jgi:septal ring factor EnvC (AmiA/AmiB activator)